MRCNNHTKSAFAHYRLPCGFKDRARDGLEGGPMPGTTCQNRVTCCECERCVRDSRPQGRDTGAPASRPRICCEAWRDGGSGALATVVSLPTAREARPGAQRRDTPTSRSVLSGPLTKPPTHPPPWRPRLRGG